MSRFARARAGVVLAAALGLVLVGGRAAAVAPNLAPNPSFESDPALDYQKNGSATFSWATDQSVSPVRSLKIVSAQAGSAYSRWMTKNKKIAVTPGADYQVSVWLRVKAANQTAQLAVTFYTAGSAYIAPVAATTRVGITDWTQLSLTVTAPANAAYLRPEFRLRGPGTLWADDVSVTEATGLANRTPPRISGQAREGQYLTATPGTWSGALVVTHFWERCEPTGTPCAWVWGGKSPYLIGTADVGKVIRFGERAHGADEGAEAYSQPTAVVTAAAGLPENVELPEITGPAPPGQTLSVSTGSWTNAPTSFSYQWLDCGASDMPDCNDLLDGANGSTFRAPWDLSDEVYGVLVAARNGAGSRAVLVPEDGDGVNVRAPSPLVKDLPRISGTPAVGSTLTTTQGDVRGFPCCFMTEVELQWLRCDANGEGCVEIEGARGSFQVPYAPTEADVGHSLRVIAEWSSGPKTVRVASAPTAPVPG
jgi:hypothetical protein